MNKLEEYKIYLSNIKMSNIYFNYMKLIFEYLDSNNIKFETITKEQIAQYFSDKKYDINSINLVIKAGRHYCKFIDMHVNAFQEIHLLKPAKKVRQYITLEELQLGIKYMATYNRRLDIKKFELVLYFLFYTGIRKSELYLLKRDDFNLIDCVVKVYIPKTKEERILPFPEKLRDKMTIYFNSEKEEYNAFNLKPGNLEYLFREVLSKHIGKDLSPHSSRHGAGKYLANEGMPLTTIQKMFGHKSLTTTMIYLEADQKTIMSNYRQKIG